MTTEPETSFIALMRAEMKSAMSELKVDLIDRFASKQDYENLNQRVTKVENELTGSTAISDWIWKAAGVVLAVAGMATTILWLYHG